MLYILISLKCILNSDEYIFGCNFNCVKEQIENIYNNSVKKLKFYEYMADDATAYKNSVATAEGVIAETIIRSDININGSNCLITGYGRCARIIADRFKALNSNVTIIERIGHKRAQARAYGYNVIDFNSDNSSDYYNDFNKYDYVINTVPQMVVDKHMLERFNRNVTIIDIASKPGGVDYDYCKKNNINAVNALDFRESIHRRRRLGYYMRLYPINYIYSLLFRLRYNRFTFLIWINHIDSIS